MFKMHINSWRASVCAPVLGLASPLSFIPCWKISSKTSVLKCYAPFWTTVFCFFFFNSWVSLSSPDVLSPQPALCFLILITVQALENCWQIFFFHVLDHPAQLPPRIPPLLFAHSSMDSGQSPWRILGGEKVGSTLESPWNHNVYTPVELWREETGFKTREESFLLLFCLIPKND